MGAKYHLDPYLKCVGVGGGGPCSLLPHAHIYAFRWLSSRPACQQQQPPPRRLLVLFHRLRLFHYHIVLQSVLHSNHYSTAYRLQSIYIYIYIYSQSHDPLFANSSHCVSAMYTKFGFLTGRHTGSVIRGRRKTIRYGREERHTDSHSYGNRCHVFRAFTDDECEVPDMLLCVKKKGGSMPKRRCSHFLARKDTQGDHCAQISYNKNYMCCGLPKPNCPTACFGSIIQGWCYLYMAKSYIASKLPNARRTENLANNSGTIKSVVESQSSERRRMAAVEGAPQQ